MVLCRYIVEKRFQISRLEGLSPVVLQQQSLVLMAIRIPI
jgi:hypothetical protein